jgi:O-antigen/teichoic acid export membrane protein
VTAVVDRGRIWRSTFSLGFGEIAARGFSFVATVHVARVLGATNFGRVEFASAIVLYASAFATFGLDVVGTRHVAALPADARVLVRTIVGLRLLFASLAWAILLGLTFLVPRLAEIRPILLLTALVLLTEAVRLNWIFQGLERMKRVAAAGILGQALYAAGVFTLLRRPGEILRVPLLSAAGSAATTVVLAAVAWKSFSTLPAPRPPGFARVLLREAAPVAATAVASLVVYNADVVLLGFLLDERHVGLYRAATRIAGVFSMLGASYTAAVFPSIARAAGERGRFSDTLSWAVRTSAVAWAAGAAVLLAAAPRLLKWTFGQTYQESVITLRLLLIAVAVVGVRAQYRHALIALKRAERNLPPTLWAAAVNVGLNLALIPRYGLRGAAIATIASETVMLLFVWLEVRKAIEWIPA